MRNVGRQGRPALVGLAGVLLFQSRTTELRSNVAAVELESNPFKMLRFAGAVIARSKMRRTLGNYSCYFLLVSPYRTPRQIRVRLDHSPFDDFLRQLDDAKHAFGISSEAGFAGPVRDLRRA